MMRKLLPCAVWCLLSFPTVVAAADPAPAGYLGGTRCKIAPVEPVPDRIMWDGPCKDGFADGKGVLTWNAKNKEAGKFRLEAVLVRGQVAGEGTLKYKEGSYTGTLRNGVPHGLGYFQFGDERGQYEGEVVNGVREGTGIALDEFLSEYRGQWKNGKRNGIGTETFGVGGSYQGEWKDNEFHGKGTITYAGSGHKHEGQFVDGRPAGAAPAESEVGRYSLRDEHRFAEPNSHTRARARVSASFPLDRSWSQLTPAQQNVVKAYYPALEEGDEPPFPVNGSQELFDAIATINRRLETSVGNLLLYVTVGTDGKAKSVTAVGSPNPELVKHASTAAGLVRYKPAMCRGKPCEMKYAVLFSFSEY